MFYTRRMGMEIHYPPPPRGDYMYWGALELDYSIPIKVKSAYILTNEDGSRFDKLFDFPLERGINYPNGADFHTVKVRQLNRSAIMAETEDISDRFIVVRNQKTAVELAEILIGEFKILKIKIPQDAEVIGGWMYGRNVYLVTKLEV